MFSVGVLRDVFAAAVVDWDLVMAAGVLSTTSTAGGWWSCASVSTSRSGDDVVAAIREAMGAYAALRRRVLTGMPSGDLMAIEYRRLVQRVLAET
jgi:hypothetical protein